MINENTTVVTFIHYIALAKLFAEDYVRFAKGTRGELLFSTYVKKIDWIIMDFKTYPHFPEEVRRCRKLELESDLLTTPSIAEKLHLLSPASKEVIEDMVDSMIKNNVVDYVETIELPKVDVKNTANTIHAKFPTIPLSTICSIISDSLNEISKDWKDGPLKSQFTCTQ